MSTDQAKFDIELVKLVKLTILNASIENKEGVVKLPTNVQHDLEFKIRPGVNIEGNLVQIIFSASLHVLSQEIPDLNLGVGGSFEISYLFLVDNLSAISRVHQVNNEQQVELPNELVESFTNIVYSTSRGIIYTRCLGTVLEEVILPVMSTKKLLNTSEGQQSE